MSTMIDITTDVQVVSNVSNIFAAGLNCLRLELAANLNSLNDNDLAEVFNHAASNIIGADSVNVNIANMNNNISAAGLFYEFKEAVSILIANHFSENTDVNQFKILRAKIILYAEFFFKFFANGTEDLRFQFDVFPEALMELAKLTKMGVKINTVLNKVYKKYEVDEYSLFCQLLIYYGYHTDIAGRKKPQPNLDGKTNEEQLSLIAKAYEEHLSNRLKEFLSDRSSDFLELCGKHLLYTAVRECVPDVFDFIPNIQELIQQGIYIERNAKYFFFEENLGPTTMTLFNFFLKPPSRISKSKLETMFNLLLNNGYNVFICGGSPEQPRSCLNLQHGTSIKINQDGQIKKFHLINLTYLTLLENGAGCLRRDARHTLLPSTQLSFSNLSPLQNDGTASTLQDLILWGVSHPLFETKQISETALQFTERLIDSELVFKVPGQMRFIFSMKEFDEYVQNFDKLSIQEKTNLRRMCESFIRLSDEDRGLLVPGFETSMTTLQEKMGISIDSFGNKVSTILSGFGLPGNAKSSIQAVIFSYLVTKDIDESNIPLPTLQTPRSMPTNINGATAVSRTPSLSLQSRPVRLPVQNSRTMMQRQPQPQAANPPPLSIPAPFVSTGFTETKVEKSFVEVQREKRKPGNKQFADTINFVDAYMNLNPDKKPVAELNHPRFRQTLEMTYRGLQLPEKIKLDQKIDVALRARASASKIPAPAKRSA